MNIIESIDGVERFLDAIDCTGHKKDMPFLADIHAPHMSDDVDLIVADGACGGLLTIMEDRYPR